MSYFFPNFHYGPVIMAVIVNCLIGLIAYSLVFKTKLFDSLIQQPLVSNFIAAPCTMLALIIAFMASSVWQNTTVAKTALWNEKIAIETLLSLPIEPAELKIAIKTHLREYLGLVTKLEWGTNFNQKRLVEVENTIHSLASDAWALEKSYCDDKAQNIRCSSSLITTTFLRSLEQMRLAREQRLSLGSQANLSYVMKWLEVYLLTTVAAINLAAGHRTMKHSAIIALVIFCACTTLLFSIVALYIHPYKGPDALVASLISQ